MRNYSMVKKILIKHEAGFFDLDIKIKHGKFRFGFFDKRDSFPSSVVRIPDKSSNVPFSTVYAVIGSESLRIAREINNPESFSTAMKPLIARMSRQRVSIEKINSAILKIFNKHQGVVRKLEVCQLVASFLLITALTGLLIGDSALLL